MADEKLKCETQNETVIYACDTEENDDVDEDLPEFEIDQEANNIKQDKHEKLFSDQLVVYVEDV